MPCLLPMRYAVAMPKPDEEAIFNVARRIAAPEARRRYVEQACGADQDLPGRIEALLHAYDQNQSFLESPALGTGALCPDPICEGPGTVIGSYKLLEQI